MAKALLENRRLYTMLELGRVVFDAGSKEMAARLREKNEALSHTPSKSRSHGV